MSVTTIQINTETKRSLKEIIDKFKLGTFDSGVKQVSNFILANDLDPTKIYYGDYAKGLVDLELKLSSKFQMHEEKLIGDNKSFRKWMGAIEKDYLKPLIEKLSVLDKISNYEINKIQQENLQISEVENPLNSHIPNVKNEGEIEENNFVSETKKQDNSNELLDLKNEVEKYKKALENIIFNSDVQNVESMAGARKKIVVNLSMQEWDNINSLI